MKQILIPTDFSENSEHAIYYAMTLVGKEPTKLHIVYVLEPFVPASELAVISTNLFQEQKAIAERKMEVFQERIKGSSNHTENVSLSCSVKIGSVLSVIDESVKDGLIDFVVMGTRGQNHNKMDRFLGTVSAMVLEHAACPILLVPHNYQWQVMNNIVYATDLKDGDKATIAQAVKLIEPNQVVVQCVYVTDEDEPTFNPRAAKMTMELEKEYSDIQTVFSIEINDSVEQALAVYADNYDAELVVMKRTKHNIFYRLLNGSHTARMVHLSHVPLLVINK